MDQLQLLVKKNSLMNKISWVITIIFIIFSSISGVDIKSLYIIGPVLIVMSIITTLMNLKKELAGYLMYIISLALAVGHFLFVHMFHDLNGFLIGFIVLCIISLYQNYKVVMFAGTLVTSTLVYGYFTGGEKMYTSFYDPLGLVIVVMVFIVVVALLCVQSVYSNNTYKDLEYQRTQSEKSKQQVENMLRKINDSISVLINFNTDFKSNVNSTGKISGELTNSFDEITSSIESQVNTLSSINNQVELETKFITNVAKEANVMKELANQNLNKANDGRTYINGLSSEIEKVNTNTNNTVELMNELVLKAKSIGEILDAVHNLSTQINLLSLNASVEAARAGEHGRGFSVVATEIGKLADQSTKSNVQIANILKDIQEKIDSAYEQINLIENSSNASLGSASQVSSLFTEINENSKEVLEKSSDISLMTSKIQENSIIIQNRINEVTEFTETTSASFEEILAGTKSQHTSINNIVQSFKILEDLVNQLRDVSNK